MDGSKLKIGWLTALVSLCCMPLFTVNGQRMEELKKNYPFLKIQSNKLQNDSNNLDAFYTKLVQLKNDKNIVVHITHIGDSHLQADILTGKAREQLQLNFGNAGRGFIVPYKVGRSNEPYSYQTSSNVVWQSKRNIVLSDSLPIGVGGLTLKTEEAGASILVRVKNKPNLNYSFNKLTLFHEKGESCFDFDIKDSCGGTTGMISALPTKDKRFHSESILLNYENSVYIETRIRSFTRPPYTMLYGILLENSKPGILYNTIGINGAEYRHYNQAKYFQEQQQVLTPDLIILSLGTNEAFSRSFDPVLFQLQVDTMVKNLKLNNPNAALLITTPGDHFRNRKYKNTNIPKARSILIAYCLQNQIAYWDLFDIMGGFGSIAKWNAKKLTSKDLLHLNAKGYEVQGELLYQSIISGLSKFELRRSK